MANLLNTLRQFQANFDFTHIELSAYNFRILAEDTDGFEAFLNCKNHLTKTGKIKI